MHGSTFASIVSVLWAVACSSSTSTTQVSTTSGPPAALTATAANRDDVQVATVNGRPVFASCVTAQAARGGVAKQEALDQCIAFELLAQRAESFATDPETVLATRTALVNQLIAREYEDKLTKPTDFGAFWDKAIERNKRLIDHPEARASVYARVAIGAQAPPEEDARARAVAEEIAAATVNERGLTPAHFKEIAERITGTRAKVEVAAVPAFTKDGLVEPYANALFALADIGRASSAVRTPWGWDVILMTDVVPAETLTPDEVVAKVLPDVKRSYFPLWVQQIAQKSSVKIFDDNVPLLEDL